MFGLVLLGLSLACKHDLAFLPLWLAMAPRKTMDGATGTKPMSARFATPRGVGVVGIGPTAVNVDPELGDQRGLAIVHLIWRYRLAVLTIPYAIWLAFFIPPTLAGGGPSIWRWVFMFRGFGNAPLWKMLIPPQVLSVVPPFALFLTALLVCGWVVTRQQS